MRTRTEINEREQNSNKKINKTKSWFFEKKNKIDKPLAKWISEKQNKTRYYCFQKNKKDYKGTVVPQICEFAFHSFS